MNQIYLKRSVLYNIEPIGLGTHYVESFSSYMSRLSVVHGLSFGIFLSKLLGPLLKKDYIIQIGKRGGNGFYDSSTGVNGIGTLANDFKNTIQELNNRSDLDKLTFKYWSAILPTRGLMRNNKVWCNICYQESLINEGTVYEQLMWCFKEVQCCIKHDCKLTSCCPFCRKKQTILSRKNIPGYCQHCNEWLGVINKHLSIGLIDSSNRKAAEFIGEMVAHSSSKEIEDIYDVVIVKSLKKISEKVFEGNIKKMAIRLGISETTMRYWIRGINKPPLPILISISLKLNISILELLEIQKLTLNDVLEEKLEKSLSDVQKRSKQKFNYDNILKILKSEINKDAPRSLKKVAQFIGCDRKLLYKKFPIESKQIVSNYVNFIKMEKLKRQEIIFSYINNAVGELYEKDEYPSRRNVEQMISHKFLVKELKVREVWKKIKNEKGLNKNLYTEL